MKECEEENEGDLEGICIAPTPKGRKLARERAQNFILGCIPIEGLWTSLGSRPSPLCAFARFNCARAENTGKAGLG